MMVVTNWSLRSMRSVFGGSIMRMKTIALALLTCAVSWHASAAITLGIAEPTGETLSPSLTYSPLFDVDDTPDATAEVAFPAAALGNTSDASVVPTATGGTPPGAVAVACSTSAGFTITGGNNQTFNAPSPGTPGTPIGLRCVVGGVAQTGTLNCTESDSPGDVTRSRVWDLVCPAVLATPEYESTPAPGGNLAIAGPASGNATGAVNVSNTGASDLTVSGCAVTGIGMSLGAVSATIAPAGTGTINVACALPTIPDTTSIGTLTCNTNDTDEPVVSYSVDCAAQAVAGTTTQSVPSLGVGALMLLAMLMMVSAFVARR
jgi:hypothetical protein